MKAAIYRFFDADGTLIYVGQTADPFNRLRLHGVETAWADEIVRVEIHRVKTRRDARLLERQVIADEAPLYNVHFNVGRWNKRTNMQLHKRSSP